MTEKIDIQNKIAERVANLGIFGTDAEKLVQSATSRAWMHCELGGTAEMVALDPETFVREGIQNLHLGTWKTVDEGNGVRKTIFERKSQFGY